MGNASGDEDADVADNIQGETSTYVTAEDFGATHTPKVVEVYIFTKTFTSVKITTVR